MPPVTPLRRSPDVPRASIREVPGSTAPFPPVARERRAWVCLAVISTLAGVLRLWWFTRTPPNPFYDAAVRSMALSWHNFFYGAFEPGGSVSVDKAPIDLWLQVASTKLLGFSSTSLRLPQALAGTLAVPLLYDLVRRGFGRRAGYVAAAALAVLPVSVLSARSDTMDTLMSTALLAAAWVIAAAPLRRRAAAVLLAGAVAGIAFEIKLFEAVVALPGLATLAWVIVDGSAARRRRILGRALAVFVGTAALWPVLASVLPGRHPWTLGSTDGSIWNVILVYNGLDRLGASGPGSMPLPPAGPLRLFTTQAPDYLSMLGVELLPALLLGAVTAGVAGRGSLLPPGPHGRARRALGAGLGVWLISGTVLFSFQGRLRLRYFEAFTPAVAAVLGIGLVLAVQLVARRARWSRRATQLLTAALAVGLLVPPLLTSVRLARAGAEDSQTLGAMPPAQLAALSRYLRANQRGSHYELAASGSVVAGPVIVRDARPVLMLTSWRGRAFITSADLDRQVHAHRVRYLLIDAGICRLQGDPFCPSVVRHALVGAADVSARAGLGPAVRLLRLRGA